MLAFLFIHSLLNNCMLGASAKSIKMEKKFKKSLYYKHYDCVVYVYDNFKIIIVL